MFLSLSIGSIMSIDDISIISTAIRGGVVVAVSLLSTIYARWVEPRIKTVVK